MWQRHTDSARPQSDLRRAAVHGDLGSIELDPQHIVSDKWKTKGARQCGKGRLTAAARSRHRYSAPINFHGAHVQNQHAVECHPEAQAKAQPRRVERTLGLHRRVAECSVLR